MPQKCAAFGCRGNFGGEPYSKLISFPNDVNKRKKWINALANERSSFASKKEIWICASNFNCDWITIREGKRPSQPSPIFPEVPKFCLKQVHESQRTTQNSTAEVRQQKQRQTFIEAMGRQVCICFCSTFSCIEQSNF